MAAAARQCSLTRLSLGAIAEFPIPEGAAEIITGPDGNLWFDFTTRHALGRVTPAGEVTVFDNLENLGYWSYRGLTAGPNGNLFVVSLSNGAVYEVFRR